MSAFSVKISSVVLPMVLNFLNVVLQALRNSTLLSLIHEIALLLESVFTEYARYLYTIGLINAAKYYCTKGGQEGKRLLEDIS